MFRRPGDVLLCRKRIVFVSIVCRMRTLQDVTATVARFAAAAAAAEPRHAHNCASDQSSKRVDTRTR